MLTYTMAVTGSPVQFGVWLMALWFTSNGPAAYLTCTSMLFDPTTPCTTQVFGFIPVTVNLWHTLCHLSTGLIGLVLVVRRPGAIFYALFFGAYYLAWGLLGLFFTEQVRHALGVDIFGSWVHVAEGLILFAIWIGDRLTAQSHNTNHHVGTAAI